ncbi:MAG: cell division FtsZ family protein [Kiritimatiellae bacterium]|nr:cell division FtsZ family protein [Kiritimatiellia bacterium]
MGSQFQTQDAVGRTPARRRVLIVGIGGGGCNALSTMADVWQDGPEMVAVHTDAQALWSCKAPRRIQIGANVTGGLSTGGDAVVGRQAAESDAETLKDLFEGVDLAFLVLGLGGGTATGAAPVMAEAARRAGALTLCFATLPFTFEGDQRRQQAEDGLRALQEAADAVVAIPNQRLLSLVEDKTSLGDAFGQVDRTMGLCIRSIWDILMKTGIINLDFQDVRGLVKQSGGTCTLAYAEAEGRRRAEAVVEQILQNPLFEAGKVLAQAQGLLVGIIGGPDLTLVEVQAVMSGITAAGRPDARVVMGAAVDENWRSKISLTVLASETLRAEPEDEPDETSAGVRRGRGAGRKGEGPGKVRQTRLNLEPVGKGRFKDVEPTIYDGQDLDTPTFVRRGIRIGK